MKRSDRRTTKRVHRASKNPRRILADDAYWNAPFLKRYLSRCDDVIMHEPAKAYAMAEPVVELADRIGIRDRDGSFRSAEQKRCWRIRARAVKASCARGVGKLSEAEALYDAAFRLAKDGVSEETKTDLSIRYGWLLFVQGNPQALAYADRALEISPDRLLTAAALCLKGAATCRLGVESGLDSFARALSLAMDQRQTRLGRRVFYAALISIATVLSDTNPSIRVQQESYRLLDQVKSHFAGRPKSVEKMQILWQQGRIAWNLGLNRHGPRLLKKARKGLAELGELLDFALVSLDLAGFYLQYREVEAYDALVADTHEVLEQHDDPRLLEAVASWSRSVRLTMSDLQVMRQRVGHLRDGEPEGSPSTGS